MCTVSSGTERESTEETSVVTTNPANSKTNIHCRIVPVGKRRDGGTRYWCLEHKADATAKYGKPATFCLDSSLPVIPERETRRLDLDMFPGGVALWGAVPPVYDTTTLPMDRGIHVHARQVAGGRKRIDRTYRKLFISGKNLPTQGIEISELEAIYFMVSSIFEFETKNVVCSLCGHPHLDKDYFSTHPHRRHLCAGCGRTFNDVEVGIGNPITAVQNACGAETRPPRSANRSLNIRQSDYPRGIQIWGTNPALLWTGEAQEEEGIHIHAYKDREFHPEIDDTFSDVTIDGIQLDALDVRKLMAQQALPSLRARIVSLRCETCNLAHTSSGSDAFTASSIHTCEVCARSLKVVGPKRKVVSNGLLSILKELAKDAVHPPRVHDLQLRAETL